jgi:hypothetical protein
MNRLEIARAVDAAAGTQGTVDSTESLTGYQALLVQFVDQAYQQIQVYRKNWNFMRESALIPLSTILKTYTNADIALVEKIIYNKTELTRVDYADWILRDHTSGPPAEYTISDLNGSIIFNTLDATYITSRVYYWSVPDIMTVNADIPILPVKYHELIIYKSLMGLGTYLGNYDLINEYSELYDIGMGQMLRTECPEMKLKARPWVTGNRYHLRNFV